MRPAHPRAMDLWGAAGSLLSEARVLRRRLRWVCGGVSSILSGNLCCAPARRRRRGRPGPGGGGAAGAQHHAAPAAPFLCLGGGAGGRQLA